MIRCDAVIVGGGPAGASCAGVLVAAGWDVTVLDRARFPRDKVCAGWLTPAVFDLLALEPADYRAAGLTLQEIRGFRTGVLGGRLLHTRYQSVVSYAIRRCEFDAFLLRRSGARVIDGTLLASMERRGFRWVVNEAIEAPIVIGAGGHFCPVAKRLRGGGPDTFQPIVAKEAEFRLTAPEPNLDGSAPELFFCRDMEGYGWCVRKGDYLNVGIGRRTAHQFVRHVKEFSEYVEHRHGISQVGTATWRGHAYLAAGVGPRPLTADGVLLIGDAAGLAYPESGEGIKPAIESGLMAARMLAASSGRADSDVLRGYADATRRQHPPARALPRPVQGVAAALGRALLGSAAFTRHVLLDRWFLRAEGTRSTATACRASAEPT